MARARAVLRELTALRDDVGRPGGDALSGQVVVGLPPTLSLALGAPLLGEARRRQPGIRLHLVEASSLRLTDGLARGDLDLALLASRPADERLVGLASFTEPLVVVAAARLAGDGERALAELAAESWIAPSAPNAMRTLLAILFAEIGIEPAIVAEVDSVPALIAAVSEGWGMSLLPLSAAAQAIGAGVLAPVACGRRLERTLHLCARRTGEPSAAQAAISGLLCQIMADEQAKEPPTG